MQQFVQLAQMIKEQKAFKSNPNYLPELQGQTKLYDVAKSDVSSDKTDFGAVLQMTTMCIFQVREIHQEKPVDGTKSLI